MKLCVVLGLLGSARSGTIEISSSDLSGPGKVCDNIKGSWSQGFKMFGRVATVSAEYDRNEKKKFLKEASLSGALDSIKYQLSTGFGKVTDLKLETKTGDGTLFELETVIEDVHLKVTKVTASRATTLRGQDVDLELSHALGPNESKLKLSSALGSGVKAIGWLTSKGGDSSMSYELEYDTDLSMGRTLSASVSPKDGSGKIEYVDSATLDGTLTANIPLGEKPTVTIKRAWSF